MSSFESSKGSILEGVRSLPENLNVILLVHCYLQVIKLNITTKIALAPCCPMLDHITTLANGEEYSIGLHISEY